MSDALGLRYTVGAIAVAPAGAEATASPGASAWSAPSRRWLALVVLCLPLLIVSLDNTVLNVVLPTLVRKLHATTSELQWIVAGERQRALGIWSGTTGAGIALGPIVAGLLLAHFWWGSVFLINVPIALLALACAIPLVPESKNPRAQRPDPVGALLSVAGLTLLVWAIIEAPVRGWGSALVMGAGAAGVALLVSFAAFERSSSHPMLTLAFFRERRFTAAIVPVGLVMFGLFGALFVLTQFLQFELGYTPLQAGTRMLPAAGAIVVVAPLSTMLVRVLGTKLTLAAGMFAVAGGLLQISGASATTSYAGTLPGMIMLGVGTGLAIPSATGSAMGSLPSEHTGVGSATNGTFLQVAGALGVAVIGSLLSTRYQHRLASTLVTHRLPHGIERAVLGSLGGALGVAEQIGGVVGRALALSAGSAFVSGMGLGLLVGAVVAAAGGLLVLIALPSRPACEKARGPTQGTHEQGGEDGSKGLGAADTPHPEAVDLP
jgi:hypothetical protein